MELTANSCNYRLQILFNKHRGVARVFHLLLAPLLKIIHHYETIVIDNA